MRTDWIVDPFQEGVTVHLSSDRLAGLLDREGKTPRDLERLPFRFAVVDPLISAALGAGFGSQSHFARAFRRRTGLTPAAYRRLA